MRSLKKNKWGAKRRDPGRCKEIGGDDKKIRYLIRLWGKHKRNKLEEKVSSFAKRRAEINKYIYIQIFSIWYIYLIRVCKEVWGVQNYISIEEGLADFYEKRT